MTVIDDHSRYLVLYLLEDKAQAKNCIKSYVRLVENKFGRKPRIIRSDRGGEFVNKELKRFYSDEGIEMQLTAGYAPEQNGVAERRNRYLQEMAMCMLLDAGLEKQYWGEAIAAAAYIQNRLPSRTVGKTPFELWSGQKPDVSHLKVFGCQAFVHVPDAKRGKMESKAEKLIFVGYDSGSKAYRFLNKQKNKITVSRDARFLELGSQFQEERVAVPPEEALLELESEEQLDAEQQEEVESEPEHEAEGEPEPEPEPCGSGANDSLADDSFFQGFSDVNTTVEEFHDADDLDESVEERELRRSQRSNAGVLPKRLEDYVVGVARLSESEPKSYKEAVNSSNKAEWVRAMEEEYESLLSRGTWSLVPLPAGRQAIGSKWVYKEKKDSHGQTVRFKAGSPGICSTARGRLWRGVCAGGYAVDAASSSDCRGSP